MTKKHDHIHKYRRVRLGKFIVFKCALGGCPHYIRKELVVDRQSICWRCEQPFVMSKVSATLERPHCFECTKSKKKLEIENVKIDFEGIKGFLNEAEGTE